MIPFDQAKTELSKSPDPIKDILRTSAYWATLQLLYVELVKNKDLVRWSELPPEKRRVQWDMVKQQDWLWWKKISVCQALYVYDYLKD